MSALTVRSARAEDAEAIVAAHEAAWDATLGPLIDARLEQLAPRAQRLERMRDGLGQLPDDTTILVGQIAGRVVGMGVARLPADEAGEVRDLYVAPEAWGTGLAAALLASLVEWLRARGAMEAGLWVVADNGRARRFYEREEWTADGTERLTDLGPGEVHYRLKLGGSA